VITIDVGPTTLRISICWVPEDKADEGVQIGAIKHAVAVYVSRRVCIP